MQTKAISAVIATIMLLMISTSLIGVFYAFSSGMIGATTSTGTAQVSQITKQLSYCMRIENVYRNQLYIRNCGKGTVENVSLIVAIDDAVLPSNTLTIQENALGIVNVSGLWQVAPGKHTIKAINGAASSAQASVEVQPNPDGLVGSWSFEEGSGNATADSSGNVNNGNLTNMNTTGNATSGWTAGKYGSGLMFDGADDYVDAGNGKSLNITNAITMEAWIYKNGNNSDVEIIAGKGIETSGGYRFLYNSLTDKLFFAFWNGTANKGSYTGVANIQLSTWYNVVATFNGTDIIHYKNGVLFNSQTVGANNISTTTSTFKIGVRNTADSQFFNGTIDEVRIWNRSLAPDEIITMRQAV